MSAATESQQKIINLISKLKCCRLQRHGDNADGKDYVKCLRPELFAFAQHFKSAAICLRVCVCKRASEYFLLFIYETIELGTCTLNVC